MCLGKREGPGTSRPLDMCVWLCLCVSLPQCSADRHVAGVAITGREEPACAPIRRPKPGEIKPIGVKSGRYVSGVRKQEYVSMIFLT